jgi:hypothetical protein
MGTRKFGDNQHVTCYVDGVPYHGKIVGYDTSTSAYRVGLFGLATMSVSFANGRKLFPTNNQGQLPIINVKTNYCEACSSLADPIKTIWDAFVRYICGMGERSRYMDAALNTLLAPMTALPKPELEFVDRTSNRWRF